MEDAALIARAAQILKAGGLVAFPTETVYGLGADARNPDAVRKIFHAKNRPLDHPVIVHLRSPDEVGRWAREVSPTAQRLMQQFWPGPLTLIVLRAQGVIDEVTGGQDTVGLRVPSHPIAQMLLNVFGDGIAAPSANRFGRISATTAAHVREELGDAVDMVLDGGACDVGIESTIVDLSTATPRLLRPGGLSLEALESAIEASIAHADVRSPRASGTLAAHYAPAVRTMLIDSASLDRELEKYAQHMPIAVLARRSPPSRLTGVVWHMASADARSYAHELYAALRSLDHCGARLLLVEAPPDGAQWDAVRDRLQRAATGSGQSQSQCDLVDDAP